LFIFTQLTIELMSQKLKQTLLILGLFTGFQSFISAQESKEEVNPPDHIKTIQLFGAEEFSGTPIMKLGTPLNIQFDDINGDEVDYYYKITHYNFDWTPSPLYKNEYLNGFDDIRIVNYENSFNTLQLYSHYMLRIPNEDTRGLKVSGNYMIEIYDDDDEIVFSRKFIVYESLANVKVYTKRSRNLKYIDTRQTVQFEISSPNEIKEIRSPTANIKGIDLQEIYHNYLYTDIVRGNRIYTYYPDINGNFVVRNLRAENSDTEADYAWIHFSLEC